MMIYDCKYDLTPQMIDSIGNVFPSRVLEMFQKAASDHAAALGVGYDAMLERSLLWVVTQVRYEVLCEDIEPGELTVRTWPLPPTRLGIERDYSVFDSRGREIIKGASVWFLIDAQSRKMSLPDNLYPSDDYFTERNFEKRARRLRDFDSDAASLSVVPDDSYIDGNRHVNNTRYAYLARRAHGGYDEKLKAYQIDFLHEVLEGERIDVHTTDVGNSVLARGECEGKGRVFICKADF